MRSMAALAVAALAAGACYTYEPVTLAAAPPGGTVRVTLTGDGQHALASTLGPDVEWVDGAVTGSDSAHVTLRVSSVQRVGGIAEDVRLGNPVSIPRADVASIGTRRVAAGRSALLAGVIGAGAIAIGESIGGGSLGGREHTSESPGPK